MKTASLQDAAIKKRPVKRKFSLFSVINALFFLVFCFLILLPLWKVLVDSLDLTTGYGMKLLPEKFGLAGYTSVFTNKSLYIPLINSIITTVSGTLIGLMLSTLGAYVLIQEEMPGRNLLAFFLLFTMIFQGGHDPHQHCAAQAGADQHVVVCDPAARH